MSEIFAKCKICGGIIVIRNNYECYTLECPCDHECLIPTPTLKDGHLPDYFAFRIYGKDKFIYALEKLGIEWGYDDKIRWTESLDWSSFPRGIVLLNGDFVYYDFASIRTDVGVRYQPLCSINDNTHYALFTTAEEAQQACEQDFQRRKASNE